MNSRKLVFAVVWSGLLFTEVGLASAQADPDSIHRQNKCRLAEQVIRTGQPANKTEWAWAYVGYCPLAQQIPLRVLGIRAAKTTLDPETAQTALMPLGVLHDGTLFREVLAIAGDRQATSTARVVAWMSLYALRHPDRSVRYEMFERLQSVEPGFGQCSASRSHSAVPESGETALPGDYREQVRAVARRVATHANEPRSVRGAAGCLM